jgi:hypothetical protein
MGGRASRVDGKDNINEGLCFSGILKNVRDLGKGGIDQDFAFDVDGGDHPFAVRVSEHGFVIRLVLLNVPFLIGDIPFLQLPLEPVTIPAPGSSVNNHLFGHG